MTLSIVIVSYNARDALLRCLESLHVSPPAIATNITLVDNASTEPIVDTVRSAWPDVRVIPQTQNRGFAAATNVGIRASQGDLILLLNGDTIVPPGAIDTLVRRLRAEPSAAVAGPRLIGTDGRAELSFGWMISPLGELRQRIVTPMTSWVERATRREQFVDWVSGACLLVTRADAEAVGLLDERYFLYTEDVDFCAAIRARGRRILFAPAAEVVHVRGRSRATVQGRANADYRRSQIAFYEKHHPIWAPFLKAYLRLKRDLPSPLAFFC
jgi:GT2 family glycosyltransferase